MYKPLQMTAFWYKEKKKTKICKTSSLSILPSTKKAWFAFHLGQILLQTFEELNIVY